MSYRIHRGMGWGMPWPLFKELSKLKFDDEDYAIDVLEKTFKDAGTDGLVVPDDVRRDTWGTGSGVVPIMSQYLLAKSHSADNKKPLEFGDPADLFFTVSTPDETTDVVFLPAVAYRKEWLRFDDDLDYAFEWWRGHQSDPRDYTLYLPYGVHPWTNSLMQRDTGEPVKWEPFTEVEQHPEWVPGIPGEIRWYLVSLGILDEAGILKLRPCIAQWWS